MNCAPTMVTSCVFAPSPAPLHDAPQLFALNTPSVMRVAPPTYAPPPCAVAVLV